jgi:hypothetical protein
MSQLFAHDIFRQLDIDFAHDIFRQFCRKRHILTTLVFFDDIMKSFVFFRGSVIESMTLPTTLILEYYQSPIMFQLIFNYQ